MNPQDEIAELKRRLAAAEAALREQTLLHAALSESETRHRLLIESWVQAIWETDAHGVVVADSPSWRAFTGQTLEEWLGYGWLDAIHPDDRAYIERQWREAVAARGLVDAEYRFRAPDGGWRWTNVRAAPVLDAQGAIAKWAGMNIDIDIRKRAEIALQESEHKFRTLFTSIDEGYLLLDVVYDAEGRAIDLHYIEANPAAIRLAGRDFTGQRLRDIDPAYEQYWIDIHAEVARTGRPARDVHYAAPHDRWFEFHISRVGEEGSHRIATVFQDVTERKRTDAALRESEDRYRSLFESMDEAYAVVDVLKDETGAWVDFRFVDANSAFLTHTSMPWPVGKTATELLGAPNPRWTQLYGQALDTGEAIRVEEAEPTLDRVFDLNIFSLDRDRDRVAVLFTDITHRTRAETALRESERWLQTLMKGVPQLVWRAVDGGHWTWASPQWTEFTGQAEADSHDWGWLEPVHPDDRQVVKKTWANAIERGEFQADYRICHLSERRYRWFQTRATPVRDDSGAIIEWLGTSTDVDDLRRAQERQQILLAELQHRVRNILAVTRSIISRSDDGERSTEDYVAHLQGRISALARTQVLLTRSAGALIDLETLIRDELLAQAVDEDQISLGGDEIAISPKSAEVLTLAIHELATNATKYGAFSRPSGRLEVRWRSEPRDGQDWVVIDWRERGVAIIDAVPRRQGFGSELISRRIPYELKGRGTFTLQPGGVESRIEFPLLAGESILQTDAGGR